MKAISTGIGSGKTKNVELGDVIDEDFCEFLTLNVKMETSRVLAEAPFWHCREGISMGSMKMLNEEFNLFRGLFPLKVVICGPPASGKSHYAAKLAEVYGIPHITIKDIVYMGQQLEDDFGKKLRERVEELKDIAA
jgi:adenylate kinase